MPQCVCLQTRLFADSCLMYHRVDCEDDCRLLQEELDRVQEWEKFWQMQFSPNKCKVLTVTSRRNKIHFSYNIQGHMGHTENAKYLELNIVDNKLSWNTHVDKINKKAKLNYCLSSEKYRQMSNSCQGISIQDICSPYNRICCLHLGSTNPKKHQHPEDDTKSGCYIFNKHLILN